jgi:hypothetical protein
MSDNKNPSISANLNESNNDEHYQSISHDRQDIKDSNFDKIQQQSSQHGFDDVTVGLRNFDYDYEVYSNVEY